MFLDSVVGSDLFGYAATLSLALGALFFSYVVAACVGHFPRLFLKRHGRRHAICGLLYFLVMLYSFLDLCLNVHETYFMFSRFYVDVVLGFLGVLLPLSAASDFGHKNITNVASGTLDSHSTVTHSEMIEHSFYQGLNLLQIVYFHWIGSIVNSNATLAFRLVGAYLVTFPWIFRDWFPVNKFSDNYNKTDEKSNTLIRVMYRIKKYQYVFYKHFLLHGLNINVAIQNVGVCTLWNFRLYWLLLNCSYVMEFFLQTMVKKSYMKQETMLRLQKILMLASSIAAVWVLVHHSNITLSLLSLALNFSNRGHEVLNTSFVLLVALLFETQLQSVY